MNTVKHAQSGSAVLIVIVVVVAVGVIGFLGYTYFTNSQQQAANETSLESSSAEDVESAPEINSEEDLDAALTTLDESDTTSSSDSTQLDSQVSGF